MTIHGWEHGVQPRRGSQVVWHERQVAKCPGFSAFLNDQNDHEDYRADRTRYQCKIALLEPAVDGASNDYGNNGQNPWFHAVAPVRLSRRTTSPSKTLSTMHPFPGREAGPDDRYRRDIRILQSHHILLP